MDQHWQTWLAALIDGEGSIMLTKRTGAARVQYRPSIAVYGTDRRLAAKLVEVTGIPRVYTHTRKDGRKREAWSWRLVVTEIRAVAPEIRPWLVLKGEQLDLLVEACNLKDQMLAVGDAEKRLRSERLEEIYHEIRTLNQRGFYLRGGDANSES